MKGKLTPKELLTLDASSLRERLEEGLLTSVDLVKSCLTQIARHDRQGAQLRAIIATAPQELLLERAHELDEERKSGRIRSPLHGIPILIKDCIATNSKFGLKTTIGSLALKDSEPGKTSSIIDKLDDMGAIILAKSNLNELLGVKAFSNTNGWSSIVGQTQSAYIPFDNNDTGMGHTNPCGSSTGSAVGVSAGFAPIALGTDSIGSLTSPATRAALYSLKPTVGSVDTSGVWRVSSLFDVIGGLTKSVTDLAVITTLLVHSDSKDGAGRNGFEQYLSRTFQGLRIGFLDPREWVYPPDVVKPIEEVNLQITKAIEDAVAKISKHKDVHVAYPVTLPPLSALDRDGKETMIRAITYEIKDSHANYLSTANVNNICSLEDMVKFNKDHASVVLPKDHPDQDWLLDGLYNRPSKEEYELDVAHFRHVGKDEGIDKLFREQNLNLLAFSTDSLLFNIASAAGYPIASMPLGILEYNGRPFGLGLIAKAGREDLMFQFMSAFEATFPSRQIPKSLL